MLTRASKRKKETDSPPERNKAAGKTRDEQTIKRRKRQEATEGLEAERERARTAGLALRQIARELPQGVPGFLVAVYDYGLAILTLEQRVLFESFEGLAHEYLRLLPIACPH
jgi:hypothetical protein